MSESPAARELGEHAADIASLRRDVDEMRREWRDDMKAMRGDVTSIKTTLSEARGGWRMLMAVGGISGLVGAGLTKALHSMGIHTP